ncbi:hypothetical protein F5Y05DRAFT_320193 [Hypoxylon sp. FL0543]|nr:hypothetical protein F5Y05DRAFT_320193 [Hypoxylon sp. FL0543]
MTPKRAITPAAVTLLIALFINASTAAAAAHENFAPLEDAALFSPNDQVYAAGLGTRWYVPAGIAKRQDQTAQQCPASSHVCLEVGPAGADHCCGNEQYCYLDSDWSVNCCGLGTTCGPCPAQTLQYCNATITGTTTIATSGTVTAVETTSETSGCCAKPCSTSSFLCQQGFGGQCCPYGASCGTGGVCLFPGTSSISTIVTPIPSGCTTSQIACPTGGGCCNIGSTCVESTVSGTQVTGLCAANLTVVDTGGLSEGARVGIGVGVAVGAAIVIGAITWFWITRRRKARSARGGATQMADGADGQQDQTTADLAQPLVRPWAGTNSDITSPSSGMVVRPRLHETGLAYGYYGPDAVPGPYTDSSTVGGTEPRSSPGFSERAAMAANRYPDNPNDIVRPVELDAPARAARAELADGGVDAGEKDKDNSTHDTSITEADQGPFELVGSPPTSPPPMTAEEAELRRSRGLSPSPEPQPDGQEEKK